MSCNQVVFCLEDRFSVNYQLNINVEGKIMNDVTQLLLLRKSLSLQRVEFGIDLFYHKYSIQKYELVCSHRKLQLIVLYKIKVSLFVLELI